MPLELRSVEIITSPETCLAYVVEGDRLQVWIGPRVATAPRSAIQTRIESGSRWILQEGGIITGVDMAKDPSTQWIE